MATVLKVLHAGEYRRIPVSWPLSYDQVLEHVRAVWPEEVAASACIIKYRDDEGDLCTLSPASMQDLFRLQPKGTVKLELQPKPQAAPHTSAKPTQSVELPDVWSTQRIGAAAAAAAAAAVQAAANVWATIRLWWQAHMWNWQQMQDAFTTAVTFWTSSASRLRERLGEGIMQNMKEEGYAIVLVLGTVAAFKLLLLPAAIWVTLAGSEAIKHEAEGAQKVKAAGKAVWPVLVAAKAFEHLPLPAAILAFLAGSDALKHETDEVQKVKAVVKALSPVLVTVMASKYLPEPAVFWTVLVALGHNKRGDWVQKAQGVAHAVLSVLAVVMAFGFLPLPAAILALTFGPKVLEHLGKAVSDPMAAAVSPVEVTVTEFKPA